MYNSLIEWSERVYKWKVKRKLTIKMQRDGYLRNAMEELGELAEAIKAQDKEKQIDAYCDILIFSLGIFKPLTQIKPLKTDINIKAKECDLLSYILIKVSFLNSYHCNLDLIELGLILARLSELSGYDFKIAMNETLKEIESRTGKYNEALKKFVKDEKAATYKANYKKALIK